MNLWFYDFYNYIALTQIQATLHPTWDHKKSFTQPAYA